MIKPETEMHSEFEGPLLPFSVEKDMTADEMIEILQGIPPGVISRHRARSRHSIAEISMMAKVPYPTR
jgi:hypothetical protein